MPTYRVIYGFRTDGGLNYSEPTAWAGVTVEAPDASAARKAAIDAAYDADPHICHVRPQQVTLLEE